MLLLRCSLLWMVMCVWLRNGSSAKVWAPGIIRLRVCYIFILSLLLAIKFSAIAIVSKCWSGVRRL